MGKNYHLDDETPGRENIQYVWKYYVTAFAGLGLVWLSQKVTGVLSSVCVTAGALLFVTGVFLTLYWDRKRKRAEEEQDK